MPQDPAAAETKVLFVDDAQISLMEGVERRIHPARKHEGNPVVTSDNDWEAAGLLVGTVRKEGEKYRMWYQSQATIPGANKFDSYVRFLLLYAESDDGLDWAKPALGSYEDPAGSYDNNIAFVRLGLIKDVNASVLYTPDLADGHNYTMMTYGTGYHAPYNGYVRAFSDDGTSWTDGPTTPVIPGYGDVGWFTRDEKDGVLRGAVTWDRAPGQVVTSSVDGREWTLPWPPIVPDDGDREWADGNPDKTTAFRGMLILRYGPVLLGFLQVIRGREVPGQGLDAVMDIQLVCSRDGTNWERVGDRRTILERGEEGSWDSGLVWLGNSLVTEGDRLVAYYSGCEERAGALHRTSWRKSIGQASWPRDRLVGLVASSDGVVVTAPLGGSGDLHVNADASRGSVAAELLGDDSSVVPGYEAENCVPLAADSLDHTLQWRNQPPTRSDARAVGVRLKLRDAEVFSLWRE